MTLARFLCALILNNSINGVQNYVTCKRICLHTRFADDVREVVSPLMRHPECHGNDARETSKTIQNTTLIMFVDCDDW